MKISNILDDFLDRSHFEAETIRVSFAFNVKMIFLIKKQIRKSILSRLRVDCESIGRREKSKEVKIRKKRAETREEEWRGT